MTINDGNLSEYDVIQLAKKYNLLQFVRGLETRIESDALQRQAYFRKTWDVVSRLTRVPKSYGQLERRRQLLETFFDALSNEYEIFVESFVNNPNMTLPQFTYDERTNTSQLVPTGGQSAIELDVGFRVPPIQTKPVKDKVFARTSPPNPFPVKVAAHHIIPNNVLLTFYNLIRIMMKVEASSISPRESYVRGVAQLNNRIFIAEQMKWRFEKANSVLPKYANLTTALDYEKFMQRPERWNDGNLFYGPAPQYRENDPGEKFESHCARIIGRKRYLEMHSLFQEISSFNDDLLLDMKRSYEMFEREYQTKKQNWLQRARSLMVRLNAATCYPSIAANLADWFKSSSGAWEIKTEDGQNGYYRGLSAGVSFENGLNENEINEFTPIVKYHLSDCQLDSSEDRLFAFFPCSVMTDEYSIVDLCDNSYSDIGNGKLAVEYLLKWYSR